MHRNIKQNLNLQIGDFNFFENIENGILIYTENAHVTITVYKDDIIRVRASRDMFKHELSYAVILEPNSHFNLTETIEKLVLSTKKIVVEIIKRPLLVRFLTKEGEILNEDEPGLGIMWTGEEVTCYKKLREGEKFIGLGEKTGKLNRRGRAFENWNKDCSAYPVNADPLYTSFPFYMGIHGNLVYGIFFDNTFHSSFNFGASNDRFSSFGAVSGEMNYYFFGASSISGIIESYTELTGRMKLPPLWSLGFQQSRYSYFPQNEVEQLAQKFRTKKIPIDVIYLDIHYMDNYKVFTFNNERFPDYKELINRLKELGIRIVVIVDPGVKIEDGYEVYEEGKKNEFFIRYPDGANWNAEVWPGKCNFPDFTNPAAREWWGKLFGFYIDSGIEGFWIDMNEPSTWGNKEPGILELDFDGRTGTMREGHNLYGLLMAKSTFEGTSELLKGKRTFVLTRSAFSGIQRYAAVWTGDNVSTDEHLLLSCRLVNSMGLTGVPFTGADIGGYRGAVTPELFARWISLGAYYPFFRIHSEYNTVSHEAWSFGEDIEEIAKTSISERYKLMPYIYSVFYESTQTGMPVSRSLSIDFTFDDKIYESAYQNQFLFGPSFLVAPVISKSLFCKLYLPDGGWYLKENDSYYSGNQEIIVEAPLSGLPVFIKEGAIIPMQSEIQHTSGENDGILTVHIYNGNHENTFVYYEDDGSTTDYENGQYLKRAIHFDPGKKEIKFDTCEGKYQSKFSELCVLLHGFENLSFYTVNGIKKTDIKEIKPCIISLNLEFDKNELSITYN